MHLKLRIQYDGTDFLGSQLQKQGRTVQGELETALHLLAGEPIRVALAGRTDSGVHAWGQVATFDFPDKPRINTPVILARALNANLPHDLAVLDASLAPPTFHARFSARKRAYRYLFLNTPAPLPILRRYALHIPQPLDTEAMSHAATHLIGTNDLAAFAGSGLGLPDKPQEDKPSTTRTIHHAYLHHLDPTADPWHWQAPDELATRNSQLATSSLWAIDLVANAFLPQMVRTIVGTLIEVGLHKRTVQSIDELIQSRDRRLAGQTAKPHGLCLLWVEY
ncbi:MAG: tRNA pseudouridine(38-40) synthase TruA [Chloroflexia bacterium]